ncbi:phosphomannomutase/phosphoglucomutase [Thermofilum pendens]|uniref:Phosphomannomutase n=1 Tax=Thermofilum pendens (strain DSM 2475 / Hrk 5) TaxID=368408 RepID=A1RYD1_THEPD|nr:phosphomannomutase/phosphoglucomutase [Thermofilum pendens]ABL78211.1 phosphomannomutase [Thermofilum pendens Hrk 5]
MSFPAHIFRAYDIRGVYGVDLNPAIAVAIGNALSRLFPGEYCVCSDTRSSSPALKAALSAGLAGSGSNVVDGGTGPIGMAIYATKHLEYHVAYVTASHLPPEWNGIKLFKPRGIPICEEDLKKLGEVAAGNLEWAKPGSEGAYTHRDVLYEYYKFLLKVGKTSSRRTRVVVDCGNGAASLIVPRLLRSLGYDVVGINCDVDPLFSVRGSEPTLESTAYLKDVVLRFRADLGVSFDGDGDRAIFFDEKGNPLAPEQAAVVILKGSQPGDVIANVECSSMVEKYVASRGGRVVRVPVGRIHMIFESMKSSFVLGVESSGHYVPYGGLNLDDGILAVLQFLEAFEKLGGPVSALVEPMPLMRKVKLEVNEEVKFKAVEYLKAYYAGKYDRVDTTDGVRVDLDYGWFLVRASNTEPVIRVTIEASTKEDLDKLEKLVREDIERALSAARSA